MQPRRHSRARGRLVASGTIDELTTGESKGWEIVASGVVTIWRHAARRGRASLAGASPTAATRSSWAPDTRPEPLIADLAAAGASLVSVDARPDDARGRVPARRSASARAQSGEAAGTGAGMISLGRIGLVAWHVFKESVRDRVLYAIAAFAVLLVAASILIGQITAGRTSRSSRTSAWPSSNWPAC